MQRSLFLLFLTGQCCFITCHLYKYHYIKRAMSWADAQTFCRDEYTDLATVANMTDVDRLPRPVKNRQIWIGLSNQTNANRKWYWSLPGLEFNQSEIDWDDPEPNDKGTENCGFIKKHGKWGDVGCCYEAEYFLCYDGKNPSEKFHLIKQKMPWAKAQIYCRQNHTDLVSGLNQLQDLQLRNKIESVDELMLIGLFRDTWGWSDGSSFSFRHWDSAFYRQQLQPPSNKCAMVDDDDGYWKSSDCAEKKHFVCYKDNVVLIKKNLTWEEALYYCRRHHRTLVTITNLDEQRWVQEKAKMADTPFVWLGLRYTCTLDFWFWVRDEVVGYKNWASTEKTDDCDMSGAMERGGEHKWLKIIDDKKFNFMCEM